MNILFTLCGRAGSKGFRNKNLKSFCGVPLLYYGIAAIMEYQGKYLKGEDLISVCLNTDSEELIDVATNLNCIIKERYANKSHNHEKVAPNINELFEIDIIRRANELGGDAVAKVDVIKNCLVIEQKRSNQLFDLVVDLDITSPLRSASDIANAVEKKAQRPDVDVVYSVTNSRRNPYFNMVKKDNEFAEKAIPSEYTARQQAPTFYDMNASIYAYSIDALRNKKTNTFFNDHCDFVLMRDTGIIDIDSEEDYQLMQVIARYIFQEWDGYKNVYTTARALFDMHEKYHQVRNGV